MSTLGQFWVIVHPPTPVNPEGLIENHIFRLKTEDYRLQTEPCLTRLVTPDEVGGFLSVTKFANQVSPKPSNFERQSYLLERHPKIQVHP